MKHKRETGEREAMLAMTTGCHRMHRVEKERVIELFGCLFTYSLDRTKQIDRYRYRSISIVRNTSPSKQQ